MWYNGCMMATKKFFILFVILTTAAFATKLPAADDKDCIWGGPTELTTYQRPYSPLMAPDIPVLEKEKEPDFSGKAVSPETAIAVRTSDGKCYAYYYKEVTRYRLVYDESIGQYRYQPVKVRVKVIIPCSDVASPCAPAASSSVPTGSNPSTFAPGAPTGSFLAPPISGSSPFAGSGSGIIQSPGSATAHLRTEVTQ